MGYIYLATSPSGKGYVGQTINTINIRWKNHVFEAFTSAGGCTKLNCAIRKYGSRAFTVIECWSCDDSELDGWEVFFIELFGTFGPGGYNLTTGGAAKKQYSEAALEKMSRSHREKTYKDWELPRGMTYITWRAEEGFRVRHKGVDTMFTSSDLTMEEKYKEALAAYNRLVADTYVPRERERPRSEKTRSLPRYVYVDEARDYVFVQKPGYPKKYISRKSLTQEEWIGKAVQYLETLVP